MLLLVGLGNPGEKYQNTKHNFGFLLVDQIVKDYKFIPKSKKSDFELFYAEIEGIKILLLKPMKYMNLSGGPVIEIKNFYKIDQENIIVLHDDLDIELGRIKLKIGGGSGGHNGLKDIDNKIGQNYWRIRLGIGRPEHKYYEIADYVLSNFKEEEMAIVDKVNQKISKLLPILIKKGKNDFLNQFFLQ